MNTIELSRSVLNGKKLQEEEALLFFQTFAQGGYDDTQIAATLATLHVRGETPTEVNAAARAMLDLALPFPSPEGLYICAAGTGGDRKGTINISTGASLVAAAAGGKVIKHGNSAVSSKTGSADVIKALQIPIPEDAQNARALLDKTGFCFLHAAKFHPAMRRFQAIRKSLGIPTLMNILGPLLNPARPPVQLMGVGNPAQTELVAKSLQMLGKKHAIAMNGSGMDEISVCGPTDMYEITPEKIEHYTLNPADLGLPTHREEDLLGGDPSENAIIIEDILCARRLGAGHDAIVANSAALLYLLEITPDLRSGAELATQTIAEGSAAKYLQILRNTEV